MSSKSSHSIAVAASFVIVAVTFVSALGHFPIPPKKGEIGRRLVDKPVKNFALTDQGGRSFRLEDARGKILAVTFVYTKCPDVCPLFTAHFAAMQRALDSKNRTDYLLLTITTDPEQDTPSQLKSYADLFKPNYANWLFLTGSKSSLERVWKNFGVSVRKRDDGHIQHTALTTLIDRRGVRRVDYYGDKWHEKELLRDLLSLADRDLPAD